MSIESARAYYERLIQDEAFRTKIQNAASNDEHQAIVRASGYNFTHEECETVRTQILESASSESELDDAELEAVAGGLDPLAISHVGMAYGVFPLQGNDPVLGLDDLLQK